MSRFHAALAAYLTIFLLASFTLKGPFRIAIWIFLVGLAFKTWLATKRD
ncbi:MAG: hypothetical protein HUU41_04875 [Bryobacteraceae bacterium]|nr:hypothetical protein [Bryobacterales bacterium]MEB2362703.1 hypothetical protein [Bryobacterales bacterium]NUN00425.1 hypothetical protein [Bryobacteraceae bacterium]